jgi:DNA polymerase elongation subunit (family B)
MVDQIKISNILFLDIETVPAYSSYDEIPGPLKSLWEKKAVNLKKEAETPESLYQRAGMYAEFGRIICICTGMIGTQEDKRVFRLKSFYAADEKDILEAFADLVTRLGQKREIDLCAHNGKEFDFPYIARRMLINGIKLPVLFDIAGKRPWEVRHLDTLELWKFGDHKHYTSLELLASVFNIDSPKSDIEGSQVALVYWKDKDLQRIVEYCRRDVIAVAQLMLRYKGEELLNQDDIIVLDNP